MKVILFRSQPLANTYPAVSSSGYELTDEGHEQEIYLYAGGDLIFEGESFVMRLNGLILRRERRWPSTRRKGYTDPKWQVRCYEYSCSSKKVEFYYTFGPYFSCNLESVLGYIDGRKLFSARRVNHWISKSQLRFTYRSKGAFALEENEACSMAAMCWLMIFGSDFAR